jgi:ribosomal protein S18 acetylase RimI-like enzyme
VLSEKDDSDALVAICSVCEANFPGNAVVKEELPEGGHRLLQLPALPGLGAGINALGCEERYSGYGAGRELLRYAVEQLVPSLFAGRERPYIWAAVLLGNQRSHRTFDALGFLHLPRTYIAGSVTVTHEQDLRPLAVSGPFTLT